MVIAEPIPSQDRRQAPGLVRCLALISPLIQEAKERVRESACRLADSHTHIPFDALSVAEILASPLPEQLLVMMARVLVLELNVARLEGVLPGDTPEDRFDSFVRRLKEPGPRDQLLSEYPVLFEQIRSRLDKWAAFSLEFLQHLCEDWVRLRRTLLGEDPGRLVKIQGGAGDTHRHGRSVMIASFSSGASLVYKPRSLAVEEHFQELLAWLNDRGAQPQFQLMRILDREDHGWSEFIRPKPCAADAEVERFYARQGSYLAVLYALHACDFHHENLIASSEHPFLIDLEALFHQSPDESSEQSEASASAALGYSVLNVGLLPRRFGFTKDYAGVDLSGLSSTAGQLSPREVQRWDRQDTDEMRLVRRRVELPPSQNTPTRDGREMSALDHADAIASGFSSTYRLLLKHRVEFSALLETFSGDEVRVIVRATQNYGTLLHESFHPDVLRDEADRRALFERLQEGAAVRPFLTRLVPAESRDLLRGDIPLFTTRPSSRSVWTSDGERYDDFFRDSAINLVRRRLDDMSEEDLERQLWIVRASIATLSTQPIHVRSAAAPAVSLRHADELDLAPEAFLSAARSVGDRLEELALRDGDGVNWIGFAFADEHHRYLTPLGPDLYDGLPGVVLFLAYLGAVSGDDRYTELAKSALKTLQWQVNASTAWNNIGGFAGWSGVAYTLAHAGVVFEDQALLAEAAALLGRIGQGIASDDELDIIGGAAGCAVSVAALQHVLPSEQAIDVIRACGERLLQSRVQTRYGTGWRGIGAKDLPLTGLAHGNAGIAYALLTVAERTGDARFRHAACAGIEYERSLFSPERGNWPDLRNKGAFAAAWCHGAPGIGLARLRMLGSLEDPMVLDEIDTALATTLAEGFGGSHILCHGDLGNADILLHATEILGDFGWSLNAHLQAARVVEAAKKSGWDCGHPLRVESPGFMSGLSGIGYALLRLADPGRVPCLLALEPPRLP